MYYIKYLHYDVAGKEMKHNIFSQLLENELEVFIKNTKLFSSSTDGHLKGMHTEATFRNIVKKFIPSELEVSNGWIYDETGNKSEERDILIYDPRKAPRFLFDVGVGIIPLSSLCYDIQIKSSLSEKKIKDAYDKFNDKCLHNALISINGTNLLEHYLKIDTNALLNPKIKILSSEQDAYYFFSEKKMKYSDVFTKELFLQEFEKQGIKLKTDKISLNGLDLDKLKDKNFTIYQWQSFSLPYKVKGFFLGMVNTLYKNNVGNYIIDQNQTAIGKILTRVIVDNEEKILKKELNLKNGLLAENFQFSLEVINGKTIISLKDNA